MMGHWMGRRALALLVLVGGSLVLGARPPVAPLAEQVNRLLTRWNAEDTFWGVYIADATTGRMLYGHNAQKAFLPASNQKVLTTATALSTLGSTYRYQTELRFDGRVAGTVMRGDFVIDGSGDPTFGSYEMGGGDPLEAWAERLARMGVTRLEGRLIGDDDVFDDRAYPEGWDIDYVTEQAGRYMGVPAGGLSYRDNVVAVRIAATRPGRPPAVSVRPEGAVTIRNDATTSRRWRGSTVQVERTFRGNTIRLTGTVARSYRGITNVPVTNPTTFTLQSFVDRLHDAGIETALTLIDIDDLADEPPTADPLFVSVSPPLRDIIEATNKESNNFYAEQLMRTYGWGGSARGGAARTEALLRRAGVPPGRVEVYDGSGLSRKNMVTPQAMGKLLVHMARDSEREAFMASLPAGGERNTTLDYRLAHIPIRAKTGSLRFVRALSGYVTRPNDNRVVFCIIANNYVGGSYLVTRTIDDIVRTLATTTTR
ncbi:D-alanyl-D-alanine carboxypeptidase/D-alanyl-D-alanine endopeptidase [Salisaeta longa]|uniref:D-alanyl-D-alanine carboxypeptidase/D-alanyl-D-alanine endopeptidase n=1 Tax=Salisaeta longa TaxID=503170 RepID=UPI0003B3789D|nr:D-alanyl-D-alanine carboxypeptidase/D-alanyl-D-alanine-endopeptidase [Salisaeta longa]